MAGSAHGRSYVETLTGVDEQFGRIQFALVDFDHVSGFVEEKCSGKRKVATAIEKIAIDDVVDAGDFGRSLKQRERECFLGRDGLEPLGTEVGIKIDGENARSTVGELCREAVERTKLSDTRGLFGGPEVKKNRLAAQRRQRHRLVCGIVESEIQRRQRIEEPGGYGVGQRFWIGS